jgi:hypothetical protein
MISKATLCLVSKTSAWAGIGAPRDIARGNHQLNNEINAGLADPKITARIR